MELKELQGKILKNAEVYASQYDVDINKDFAIHKLYEELGEFVQAYLTHTKQCRPEKIVDADISMKNLSDEFADVFGLLVVCADRLDIDIEKAIASKWNN